MKETQFMKSFFLNVNKSNPKDAAHFNKRVITFLFCLLISVFIWLLLSLSKEYTISVTYPVQYINLPTDKLVANRLPESVDFEIKASGFRLLLFKLKQQRESISIDIKDARSTRLKNNYFIQFNDRLDKITRQFYNGIKVLSVNPDTVFINYNKKITKTVPVKANLTLEFEEQYQQTNPLKVEPEFIDISGTAEDIALISFVTTVPLHLKKVNKNLSLKIELSKTAAFKKVTFSQNSIQAKVTVKKFTEASLELPVEVVNLPNGLNLKTFPDKVSVKYQVAFDDYGKIAAPDFKLAVDYSKIEQGSNKLKVIVLKTPISVRSVKLSNEKVEYIIRK